MTVVQCTTAALQRGLQCAREARQAVAQACRGLARDVIEIAQLLTSELVTNALQHGSGGITVEVIRSPKLVRVCVADEAPTRPVRTSAEALSCHGRGLMLVESLAARWDVTPTSSGKRVWFELRTA